VERRRRSGGRVAETGARARGELRARRGRKPTREGARALAQPHQADMPRRPRVELVGCSARCKSGNVTLPEIERRDGTMQLQECGLPAMRGADRRRPERNIERAPPQTRRRSRSYGVRFRGRSASCRRFLAQAQAGARHSAIGWEALTQSCAMHAPATLTVPARRVNGEMVVQIRRADEGN